MDWEIRGRIRYQERVVEDFNAEKQGEDAKIERLEEQIRIVKQQYDDAHERYDRAAVRGERKEATKQARRLERREEALHRLRKELHVAQERSEELYRKLRAAHEALIRAYAEALSN